MSDEQDIPSAEARRRQRLFLGIAVAFPLVFLLLVEAALRLGGFGDDYPLFVELEPAPDYLQPNPDVIKRFFVNPDNAPEVSIDTGYFRAQKPADGLRLVVQGGSSAAGFPYGKNASPAGMLQQRLTRSFPDRTVEVILTAMSAVNSWTLLEFADEIVAQQPDAVLIYAGHNEYLGVLGVGSTFGGGRSAAMTKVFLQLREWRLLQLVQRIVGLFAPERVRRSGTLMANVAGERSIALDSPLFDRGVEQFRSNLDALLARYAAAGIPVFIGTLASNEKDQQPFMGLPVEPGIVWTDVAAAAQDPAADDALETATGLVERFPGAAGAHFLLGRARLAVGNADAAAPSFYRAIDLDRLRFRAPTVFQQVIRDAAARHDATVVEVHDRLAGSSGDGLIGYESMLEHLHPNANGYYLLADAFYEALAADGLGLDWRHALSAATARREQPLSRIEKLHGEYRVAALMNDWPFVGSPRDYVLPQPAGVEEQIAQDWYGGRLDWIQAMNQGLVHYQQTGDFVEAARVAVNIADAFPFEAQPQHLAGMMLVQQTPPQGRRAIRYFHRAVTLQPRSVAFLTTLTRAYYINGFPDAARAAAERLRALAPQNDVARQVLQRLDETG